MSVDTAVVSVDTALVSEDTAGFFVTVSLDSVEIACLSCNRRFGFSTRGLRVLHTS